MSVRYSLHAAAKVAGMRHATLSRLIKAGTVPGAWYVEPLPGATRGRYVIFRAHFDAWVGIAAAPEPEPKPDAPAGNPFIVDIRTRKAS